MIKNILYSLLLHSTFAFLIYFNFRHIIQENIDLKDGVIVGIVSMQDLVKPAKVVATPEVAVKKKEKPIIKKTSKPKIKNTKAAARPLAKPILDSKAQFKKTEEEKTKEVVKKVEEEKVEEEAQKIEEEKPVEAKEEEEEKPVEEVQAANAENNNAPDLESLQLSAREKFNIQSQLRACYKRALINVPKSNFTALVKVTILPDGTIDFDQDKIIDAERYNSKDLNYKNRMDSVLQTLELCSPLRNMPSDKYEIWREFTIEFGD